MKKFLLKSLALIVSVGILFYGVTFALILPSKGQAFANNYQKGFVYQYRALERAEGKKIITIGASNVAFNTDTALMREITGVPAYNLGIHGGMGYHYILETALKFVDEGDTVIYPFWHFSEDDYGMGLIWLSLEGEQDLIFDFIKEHPVKALSTVGQFGLKKVYASILGNKLDTDSLDMACYRASCFDAETGNYIYERGTPIVSWDAMHATKLAFSPANFDSAFVSTLSEFISACRAKGAEVYFTFHSIMSGSLVNTAEELAEVRSIAEQTFSVEFLNDASEVTYPFEYYYNSPTHLNTAGMKRYTEAVANALVPYLTK
ncbi:MAG: hypothetical protein J5993_05500 [Clostridia bacterium]|nr:hypothetical protein [Clostridia bacterium]